MSPMTATTPWNFDLFTSTLRDADDTVILELPLAVDCAEIGLARAILSWANQAGAVSRSGTGTERK